MLALVSVGLAPISKGQLGTLKTCITCASFSVSLSHSHSQANLITQCVMCIYRAIFPSAP